MTLDQLRIASRRSQLAMVQTNWVRDELQKLLQEHGLTEAYTLDLLEEMCQDYEKNFFSFKGI